MSKTQDQAILKLLREITKNKENWETLIGEVVEKIEAEYSDIVKAKALWLLGEMGLKYPHMLGLHIEKIATYLDDNNPKIRERAVNALGRIGRRDKNLILPYFDKLMSMKDDAEYVVRLAFVWASENIATNAPYIFYYKMDYFICLMNDKSERVRIEAPEMFRVMGKRLPHIVEPYLKKLYWFLEYDANPVVRIHSAGAIRITKKTLEEELKS